MKMEEGGGSEGLPMARVRKAKPRMIPIYPMRGRIHMLKSKLELEEKETGKEWT